MSHILEARNLTKFYGNIKALNDFSFTVEPGSVYGILGPNGSGKTTCLGILLDVLKADRGSYSWFGMTSSHNIRRRKIGALIETPNFYPYLSAMQNLKVVAEIKKRGHENIENALRATGLHSRRNSRFSTFSLGMKQRLAIAATLLGNPDALVLDEPTNGLDPQGIKEIRDLILQIAAERKTILIASHLLDEVEKICTHVAILKSGELLAAGKVSEVLGSDELVEVAAPDLSAAENIAREMSGIVKVEKMKDRLVLKFSEPPDTGNINRHFFEKGVALTLINMKRRSLENLFMEITGKNA